METIHCPKCHASLSLPESALGGMAECPRCAAVFPAAVTPPLAEPVGEGGGSRPPPIPMVLPVREEHDDEPPRARRDRPVGEWGQVAGDRPVSDEIHVWRSVRTGAGLYLVGHALYLAGIGVLFVLAFMSLGAPPTHPQRVAAAALGFLLVVVLLMVLSNWALAVIATGFWIPALVRHGARGLAVASLVVGGVALLEVPGTFLRLADDLRSPVGDRLPGFGPGLGHVLPSELLVLLLLEVTRLAVFPFFLRAVGKGLKAPGLAAQGLALGIGTIVLFAGTLTLDVLPLLFQATHTGPGFLQADVGARNFLLLVNLIVPLGVILWGLLVLQSARSTIASKLRYM